MLRTLVRSRPTVLHSSERDVEGVCPHTGGVYTERGVYTGQGCPAQRINSETWHNMPTISRALLCVFAASALWTASAFSVSSTVSTVSTVRSRAPSRALVIAGEKFDGLSTDQKVAMVRVANCLAPQGDGFGPFASPVKKPEWAALTNETLADIKTAYPIFEDMSDVELSACVAEVKSM